MKTKNKKLTSIVPGSKSFLIVMMVLWTSIILVSLFWNLFNLNRDIKILAKSYAKASYQKDIIYRRWNAKHGGAYVPTSKETVPNPYLDVKEKVILTPSGKELTLINPAFMTRQVYELSKEDMGLVGHMTSLKPINPDNAPDDWEEKALQEFEKGKEEYSSIIEIDGQEVLRFMKPFFVEKGCLKCHEQQAYKLGDIRGGISLAVPLSNFDGVLHTQTKSLLFAHIILWLVGIISIFLGTKKISKNMSELKESEQRLRDITLNSNDWIWETDKEGRYTFVLGNTEQTLGLIENELIGKTPFDFMAEDERKRVSEIFISFKDKKEAIKDLENWNVNKDGEEVCLLINAVPILDENNNLVGYRGIDKDITEEKRAESKIRHLQKMESIGTLAAGIAHEINTPAQFINDNLSFLKDAYSDVKPLLDFSRNLNDNSTSISELKEITNNIDLEYLKDEIPSALDQSIEGLNKVSKIIGAMRDYTHAGPKEKVSADIHKVIENSLTLSRATWKYFSNIEKIYDDTLPPIICQASELNQVLINLMVNATHAIEDKFKDSDKIEGIIKIETRTKENLIEIIISDNGKGMSEKVKERIFDPFFTTKDVGKGTGQGLAIAHDIIVNKHSGNLEVESEENIGTKFTISLPTNVVANVEWVEESLE